MCQSNGARLAELICASSCPRIGTTSCTSRPPCWVDQANGSPSIPAQSSSQRSADRAAEGAGTSAQCPGVGPSSLSMSGNPRTTQAPAVSAAAEVHEQLPYRPGQLGDVQPEAGSGTPGR